MYTAHFGLNAAPFTITPDPHYLYLSARHREALAHLLYGVNEGPGFVLLTGEVGTGKTTLCRCLIEQLPETVDVALILNPRLSPIELLATLFDELRISYNSDFTFKDFIDTLHSYLLTAHAVGRRTVLILDEAQSLSTEVLEQVRLLTNLETANHKLLQIILVGQPELKILLKQNNLRQLAQRITARYHLLPLLFKDTQAYINHRLAIGGARGPLFVKSAIKEVYRYSGGVPRLINVICDRALLGGYVKNQQAIDAKTVRKAVQEVRGEKSFWRYPRWLLGIGVALLLLGVGAINNSRWQSLSSSSTEEVVNSPSTPTATLPVTNPSVVVKPRPLTTIPQPSSLPVDLAYLLQTDQVAKDAETAFTTLFQQWKIDYLSLTGNTACDRATLRGLACLYKTGTWEELRTLNRPAVLELITDNGKQHYIVLTQLQHDQATLAFGDRRVNLALTDITPYWLGQFLLLWQPPKLPVPILKAGITNEAVVWVKKHLALAEGYNAPTTVSATFDNALRKRIIMFQQRHGMVADGVAGDQTMLFLQAFAPQEPTLKPASVSLP